MSPKEFFNHSISRRSATKDAINYILVLMEKAVPDTMDFPFRSQDCNMKTWYRTYAHAYNGMLTLTSKLVLNPLAYHDPSFGTAAHRGLPMTLKCKGCRDLTGSN